jgi:integrase
MGRKPADKTRFLFTMARLRNIAAPKSGRVYHHDTAQPGLQCCVTHNGTRTYYFVKRINGRPDRIRIGTFAELSLSAARIAAATMAGQIAKGYDVRAEKRTARDEWTLRDLADAWMEHARGHKKSWQRDEARFRQILLPWAGSRRLSAITKELVVSLHNRVATERGKAAANRVLSLLHAAFNYAVGLERIVANPIAFKRFAETSRARYLKADELRRLFSALEGDVTGLRDYVVLSLCTAARKSNVLGMKWSDIDTDQFVWTIPAIDAKGDEVISIPLVAEALEVLRRRRQEVAGEWVFPGRKGGHITEVFRGWAAMLRRADLHDVTPHDLRRTAASVAAQSNVSLQTIGALLGHRSTRSTAIYSRLSTPAVRSAVEIAVAKMFGAAQPEGRGE